MSVIEELRACGVICLTRAEWGSPREADGSYRRRSHTHPMPPGPAPYHYLHITVTPDTDTVQQGIAGAQQIEKYGYSTPPTVSYQDLVSNEGVYYEGQSYGVKGTHTVNDLEVPGFPRDLNLLGYATALMQDVEDEVTDVQVRVVALIFAIRELKGWVRRGAPVFPHRRFANKSCPGDRAMARLAEIERLKNKFVRFGLPLEDDMAQHSDQLNQIEKNQQLIIQKLDRTLAKLAASREREVRQNAVLRRVREQITDLPTREEIDELLAEEDDA